MTPLALGLAIGLVSAVGVVIGAEIVLRLSSTRKSITSVLLAFAAGTLLGAACLGLIPESAELQPLTSVMWQLLAGIIAFFVLERLLIWRHCHEVDCESHHVAGYLILFGDGIHNLVDGLLLGAAFLADPVVGLSATIAVLAHEIPQEVGDYILLLEAGLSKARALSYNLLTALIIVPGVIVGYLLADTIGATAAIAMAFAAGGFVYVALADLVPHLHRHGDLRSLRVQLLPLLGGILVIVLIDLVIG